VGSDRPDQPEQRPGEQARWVARVGTRLSPSALDPPRQDMQHLEEFAKGASVAARRAALQAEGAAGAAARAGVTAERLGTAPTEQARATARETAIAAELAADSSSAAREQAELVDQAVRFETEELRGRPRDSRPEQRPGTRASPRNPEKT